MVARQAGPVSSPARTQAHVAPARPVEWDQGVKSSQSWDEQDPGSGRAWLQHNTGGEQGKGPSTNAAAEQWKERVPARSLMAPAHTAAGFTAT